MNLTTAVNPHTIEALLERDRNELLAEPLAPIDTASLWDTVADFVPYVSSDDLCTLVAILAVVGGLLGPVIQALGSFGVHAAAVPLDRWPHVD